MLFCLRSVKNASLVYLLRSKQYSVGRKECDILITDDQSISRKHATLTVKNNTVLLCDFKSKYNTFVDGNKIQPNNEFQLKSGSTIKFGMLESVYIFEEIPIITTTSGIKSENKARMKSDIDFLNGIMVSNWNSKCTHVTVEEIFVTVKVVCAIISGVPLVVPKYWSTFVDSVKKNLPTPCEADYIPKYSELLCKQNLSVEYCEDRRSLFNNKIFVFPTTSDKLKMEDLIILAGGKAISWTENSFNVKDLENTEYLIVQTNENNSNIDDSLSEIINYNKILGKRTIAIQEIALAIIGCSCEQNCNPYVDQKGIVLKHKIETQQSENMVLAMETESQSGNASSKLKSDLVIPPTVESSFPPTFENTRTSSVCDNLQIATSIKEINGVKREGESIEHLNASKKVKVDISSKPEETKNFENLFANTREVTKERSRAAPGKTLFAFKTSLKDKNTSNKKEDNNLFNLFSKKRKELDSDMIVSKAKKTSVEASVPLQQPSTSKSITKINPFTNILKQSNTDSSKTEKIVTVFKTKPESKKSELSVSIINDVNSMQLNSSLIVAVDSVLQNSYSWISKSHCNKSVEKQSTITNQNLDDDITKYIESFRNTVIIEEESMIVRKSIPYVKLPESTENRKNFKKFKKIFPLKIQTVIIPESSYKTVICDVGGMILVTEEAKESDDEAQIQKTKKKGRQFQF